MSKTYVRDMTKGNIVSHLFVFSLPMLVGNLFQQFYNMVDSIIVGKFVGPNALAAVGVTSSLNFLIFSVCNGAASGIGVLVAQYFGAGNREYVKRSIINSFYVILGLGAVMSILGVCLSRTILQLLNTPPEILDDATTYMRILSGGMLGVAFYNCISSILRALGDSRSPLYFLILSSILNVLLDLLFVLVLDMGVKGVAVATVAAQVISAVGSFFFALAKNEYFRIDRSYFALERNIVGKCLRIGMPMAGQMSMIALSCVVLQGVVNQFGAMVVAAYTATNRIEQLVQQPFSSLGTALATFTGQNVGAGKIDRVKRGYKNSILMVAVFSAVMLLVMWVFSRSIMTLFVDDSTVIELGSRAIRITGCMYFALGMIYVTRSVLNGAGDAMYALINGVMEVLGRVGFSNFLTAIPAIGMWGIWFTTGFTWVITAAASVIRYTSGKWKNRVKI